MSLFSEIEERIERGFRNWTGRVFGPAESNELIVLHHAILEEIEGQVQTLARGRRVFPYPQITVMLVASEAARRELLQAAFGERLPADIREALGGAGCEVPRGFAVEVRTQEAGAAPFAIEYGKKSNTGKNACATLVVMKGRAERAEYALEKARTNIGRMAELTDFEQRVVRRNDVVFEEGGDEANGTVSRRHAHIRLEEGEYRICDDESEFGTRIFRDGRPIDVPAGNRRGAQLRSGDEIYLGRACLRFERQA